MTADEFHDLVLRTETAFHFGAWLRPVDRSEAYWSAGMYRLLGLHPSLPASHDLFVEAVHHEDRQMEPQQDWAGQLGSDLRIIHRSVRLRQAGGGYRHVRIHQRYLPTHPGIPGKQIGVVFDPTEGRHADLAAQHLLGQLGGDDSSLSTDGVAASRIYGGLLSDTRAVTPPLLRAARAMLDWSVADMARASGLSSSTLRRVEEGVLVRGASVQVVRATLGRYGVRFVELGGALGVTLASSPPAPSEIPGFAGSSPPSSPGGHESPRRDSTRSRRPRGR